MIATCELTGQNGTAVVSIPVDMGEGVRPQENVSMWEQLSLAAFMQRHWADNQVGPLPTSPLATEYVSYYMITDPLSIFVDLEP